MRLVLHCSGYRFLPSVKKGLIKKDDLKKRHKIAHKVTKMLTGKFWVERISFYIYAAGIQHKYNTHRRSIRTMACQFKKMKAYTLTALLKDLTWAGEEG